MPRPRLIPSLVPTKITAIGRPARVAAAVGGVALVGVPVIGAVANRVRGVDGDVDAPDALGLATATEAERANQAAQTHAASSRSSGTDFGAGPGSWSLEGAPGLLGLGGKVVAAGIDGASEIAELAGHGLRGAVEVADAVGSSLPDLGDIAGLAGAVGDGVGAVLGAIGDGLGDLNV